jgi:hypothetical protein
MRRFVIGFIATVFVLILTYWIVVVVILGKVISDPEGAAEKVGGAAKKIQEGFEKGYQDGFGNDTIHIDSVKVE